MTEPSTELTAVHTAITELAAIVAGARAALGGGAGRAGNQLEMAEWTSCPPVPLSRKPAGKSTSSRPPLEMSVDPCGLRSRSACRTVRSSPTPDGRADRVVEHPDKDNANCSRYPPPTTSGDSCMERERALP